MQEKIINFFKQNKHIVIAVCLGLFVVGFILTILYQQKKDPVLGTAQETTLEEPIVIPEAPQEADDLAILLIGYGGAGHQGGYLSDIIQVAYLDFDNETTSLISIPRDLWVSLPSGTQNKVNAAYNLDRGNNDKNASISKEMAQAITGIPIDYYAAIDFVGFQRLIGIELGGIEVNVGETLDDPWYPIRGEELNTCGKSADEVAQLTAQYSGFQLEKQFPCRYKHIYYEPGISKMEGGDALAYVRSRHGSAGGDFSRSQRQQEMLEAIRKELFQLSTIKKLPAIYKLATKHTQTDIDLEITEEIWPAVVNTEHHKIKRININTSNVLTSGKGSSGQYILKPKNSWANVQQFVKNQIDQ